MTYSNDYPEVDLKVLNQAAKAAYSEGINIEQLYTQTDYLSSVSYKVSRIDNALRVAHHRMKHTLQSLSDPAAISLQLIARYETAYKRAPDSSKPALLARMTREVSKILQLAGQTETELQQLSAPLVEPIELDATHRFLVQLGIEAEQLPMAIEALNLRREQLDQERKTLTDALSLIESKGFAQVGKDTLLNAQEVSKLALASPELAMLDQAVEFAHKVLDEAQGLISYVSLTKARDIVRHRIDQLLVEISGQVEALRLVGLRRELIMATHRFEDHRSTYISEFEKIPASLGTFLMMYRLADLHDENLRSELVNQAHALIAHFNTIALTR